MWQDIIGGDWGQGVVHQNGTSDLHPSIRRKNKGTHFSI